MLRPARVMVVVAAAEGSCGGRACGCVWAPLLKLAAVACDTSNRAAQGSGRGSQLRGAVGRGNSNDAIGKVASQIRKCRHLLADHNGGRRLCLIASCTLNLGVCKVSSLFLCLASWKLPSQHAKSQRQVQQSIRNFEACCTGQHCAMQSTL
jgi:hypothetical protein